MSLILTPLPGIPLVQEGDDLTKIALQYLGNVQLELQDGDILVFTQKIVSKAEGRRVNLAEVTPSPQAETLAAETEKDPRLVELLLKESKQVLRKRPGLIIVEHNLGFICANAGIDHSNVAGSDDWVLLLPEDPDASAHELRRELENSSGARLGVLIIDSHGRAWRNGTVGVTIGISGLPGVVDLRGTIDLFGYELQVTEVGAADELAAAASLMMGQVAEGTPVVHVRGFPYPLREADFSEILRPEEKDMFR
jgi:coenzyme F420-0:L-glutamate ligase/coenzyme F420-1:gamma-L-glutamate ligase